MPASSRRAKQERYHAVDPYPIGPLAGDGRTGKRIRAGTGESRQMGTDEHVQGRAFRWRRGARPNGVSFRRDAWADSREGTDRSRTSTERRCLGAGASQVRVHAGASRRCQVFVAGELCQSDHDRNRQYDHHPPGAGRSARDARNEDGFRVALHPAHSAGTPPGRLLLRPLAVPASLRIRWIVLWQWRHHNAGRASAPDYEQGRRVTGLAKVASSHWLPGPSVRWR